MQKFNKINTNTLKAQPIINFILKSLKTFKLSQSLSIDDLNCNPTLLDSFFRIL